jgi:hypothetical protein
MRRSSALRIVILVAVTAAVTIWIGLRLRDGGAGASVNGTGLVAGVVLDSQGRGLGAVNVRISSPRRQTTTDTNGHFSFERLPASTYEISVEKEGYLTPDLGAGWLASPGTTIQLEAGQQVGDLAIAMVQGGAIAGVVYDQKGQPATGRFVRALRAAPQGPDVLVNSGTRSIWSTDELGRYLITGLPAGEYVVMAALDRTATERVYHPNVSRFAEATAVTVELGQDRTGVDLRAPKVRTSRIQGRITREDGAPMSVPVDLIRSGETEPDDRRVTVTANADGRFVFENIPADDYWIVAHDGGSTPLWATADVTTTGRNAASVLLTMQAGRSISGRLAFQSIAALRPDTSQTSIYLIPADARTRAIANTTERARIQAAADGEFTIAGLPPGKYVLRDSYVGPWLLESAVVGKDRLDVPFDVQADRDVSGALLTLTDQLSEVNGTVQVQGRAVTSQIVMAFAADERFWGWLSPRVRLARSDGAGRFVIAQLPAGEYFVTAPDTFAPGAWFDYGFLTKVQLQATRVTLAQGERQTLTISLQTPPR